MISSWKIVWTLTLGDRNLRSNSLAAKLDDLELEIIWTLMLRDRNLRSNSCEGRV